MSADLDNRIARIASWLESHAGVSRCEDFAKYARTLAQTYDVEDFETCSESDFVGAGMQPVHANRAAKAAERTRESRTVDSSAASPSKYRFVTSKAYSKTSTEKEAAITTISAQDDEEDDMILITLRRKSNESQACTEVSLLDLRDAVADLVRGAASVEAGDGVILRRRWVPLLERSSHNDHETAVSNQGSFATTSISRSPPSGDASVVLQSRQRRSLPSSPETPVRGGDKSMKREDCDSSWAPLVDPRLQPESTTLSSGDAPQKPLQEWTARDVSRWIRGFEKLKDIGAPPKLVDGKMLCRIRSRADVDNALGIRVAVDQFFLLRELSKLRASHEPSRLLIACGNDGAKSKLSRDQLPPIASTHDGDSERGVNRRHTWTREQESTRARRGLSSGERAKKPEILSPSNARVPHLSNYAESKPPSKPSSKVRAFSKSPITKGFADKESITPRQHAVAVVAAGPESPTEGIEREHGAEALRLQIDLGLQMDLAAIDKDAADQFEQSYEFSDDGTLLDWRSGLEITGGKSQRPTTSPTDSKTKHLEMREQSFSPHGAFVDAAQKDLFTESIVNSSNNAKADRVIAINADDIVIFDELGRGACASVRKALHVPSLTMVAVKMVAVHDDSRRRQLLRELAALHQFSTERLGGDTRGQRASSTSSNRRSQTALRKHIVAFHGAFTNPTAGCVCAVLEFMDARSVHDTMEARNWEPLDLDSLSVIAHGCVAALAALHADRQLHRDVKPSNVLLDWRWRVKLSDFGVSRAVDNTLGIAQTYIGTLAFMAPERIVGGDYSFPSDIWSIGLCFATVALGRVPLPQSDGYWAVVRTICDGDPPRLDPELYDASLCQLTNACLSRAPDQRPTPASLLDHPFVKRGEELVQRADATLGTPNFQFPAWQHPERRSAEDTQQQFAPESLMSLRHVAIKASEWRTSRLELNESEKAQEWQQSDFSKLAEQLHTSVDTVCRVFQEEAASLSRAET